MGSVTLKNINKRYDSKIILDGINLEIHEGEFLVLLGPSGCGKSTLLRIIAGLEPMTEGEVLIGNRSVNQVSPKDRDVAMVFQNYALYPHMNVFDNMAFGLKMRKMDKAEREKRVESVAQMLELTDLLKRKPAQLSGGQRQRVALGRAIVRSPQVFLMDEPLSNLDAKLRAHTRLELERLHQQLKTTTIYVTHDQVEAMTLGERVVVLHQGKIQQIGQPDVVYQQPDNLFVAKFMGQISFIEATVDLNQKVLQLPDQSSWPLISRLQSLVKDKQKILLGIRPEEFVQNQQVSQGQPNSQISVKIHMDLVESLGKEKLCYGQLATTPVVAQVTSQTQVEKEITAFVDLEKLHYFDPETQQRL